MQHVSKKSVKLLQNASAKNGKEAEYQCPSKMKHEVMAFNL